MSVKWQFSSIEFRYVFLNGSKKFWKTLIKWSKVRFSLDLNGASFFYEWFVSRCQFSIENFSNPLTVQCNPVLSSTLNQCDASESEGSDAIVLIGFEFGVCDLVCGEPKYMLGDWLSLEYLKAQISFPLVNAHETRSGSVASFFFMTSKIIRNVSFITFIGSEVKPLLSAVRNSASLSVLPSLYG